MQVTAVFDCRVVFKAVQKPETCYRPVKQYHLPAAGDLIGKHCTILAEWLLEMIPDLRAGSSRYRLKPLSEWRSETKRYWKHEADSAQLSTDSHCHTTAALEKQGCTEFTQAALSNTAEGPTWQRDAQVNYDTSVAGRFIPTEAASRGLKWRFFCIL